MKRPGKSNLEYFYLVLALSLFARVSEDIYSGVYRIHTGELYAWRHLFAGVPIFPVWTLYVEWAVLVAAGGSLMLNMRRTLFARLATAALFFSLTQMYQNQKTLQFLVFFFLALDAPDAASSSAGRKSHPVLWLLRCQLLIVYLFSALNKIFSGFVDGATLANTLNQISAMPDGPLAPRGLLVGLAAPGAAQFASVLVLSVEFLLPVALLRRPRPALACVVGLHFSFALLMPSIWPFTFTMIALAVLFLK